MLDDQDIDAIRAARQAWEPMLGSARVSRGDGAPAQADPALDAQPLYTPADLADHGVDYLRDLGFPGQYPFTRGIHPSMYRGRVLHHAPVRGLRLRARRPTAGSATCSSAAWRASTSPSTCPRSTATTPTTCARGARSGKVGRPRRFPSRPRDALRRHPARSRPARQRHRRPRRRDPGHVRGPRRAPGRAARRASAARRRTTS